MRKFKEFVRGHSIDNLRIGKVISKDDTRYVVRVGNTKIVCYFTGSAVVGDIVTLECPDGEGNKGYILGTAPLILGEGGNVIL